MDFEKYRLGYIVVTPASPNPRIVRVHGPREALEYIVKLPIWKHAPVVGDTFRFVDLELSALYELDALDEITGITPEMVAAAENDDE